MFINVAEELKSARSGGYALGAFNTCNLEVTKAICKAAAETEGNIIIQTTPGSIKYSGLEQIFSIIKNEIESSNIKAAIHVDHANDFEIIREAIEMGYRSVMIDGSKLPFEENIALTKRVVEFAKTKNVSVEGEIGVLGKEEGGMISGDAEYSSPDQVRQFVELTGIDSVAVSVGNEHGAPKGEKIDFELLEKISGLISIPLVMHGASGLSDLDIKRAIGLGISKINIDTNIRCAFIDGMRDIPEGAKDYRDILEVGMEKVTEVVKQKILLFQNK